VKWSQEYGGVLFAQPLVTNNTVLFATEGGDVFALDATTGQQLWKQTYEPLTSTYCEDVATWAFGGTGLVEGDIWYFAGLGNLYALYVGNGLSVSGWPVENLYDDTVLHNYGGLNKVGDVIYITLASLCDGFVKNEPRKRYTGTILGVNVSSLSQVTYYEVVPNWDVDSNNFGAGIWGQGGVAVASIDNVSYVFAGTGNTQNPNYDGTQDNIDNGNSVVKLALDLTFNNVYTSQLARGDYDFGSTPSVFAPTASMGVAKCPTPIAVAQQKSGELHILNAKTMKGIAKYQLGSPPWFMQTAVYNPKYNLLYLTTRAIESPPEVAEGQVFNYVDTTDIKHGLAAFNVLDTCGLSLNFSTWVTDMFSPLENAQYSTPVIAGDVVYFATGNLQQVFAVHAVTGEKLWSENTFGSSVAAPTVVGDSVYVSNFWTTPALSTDYIPHRTSTYFLIAYALNPPPAPRPPLPDRPRVEIKDAPVFNASASASTFRRVNVLHADADVYSLYVLYTVIALTFLFCIFTVGKVKR
jgi:outer membrane protein assembly factor BamB